MMEIGHRKEFQNWCFERQNETLYGGHLHY